MTKKQRVNKTKAVKEYVAAHPEAVSSEIADALGKQGITITAGYVANIKTKINKGLGTNGHAANAPMTSHETMQATEKPSKLTGAFTLAQIKRVSGVASSLGGSHRVQELLAVVHELGGIRQFEQLFEAISSIKASETEA